ncbi:Zn-dependent hydrolase [Evansella sp. AB-rgal1]|uniref:Zn-dependent hydrolase n=1 Tax=Evansella sp. AB-rgal1 TaxID=3242696 RepID=UPI00359E4426
MEEYKINEERLWNSLMDLAQIGALPEKQGVTRLSLSEADLEGRKFLIQLMKDCGLHVRIDKVGNIIGKLEGCDNQAPIVMTGSHIDTVYEGGKFDGTLGVLGALEAVRTIKEKEIRLTHSIEVVSFTDEEGTRFGTGYIGSKGMVGKLDESYFRLQDDLGTSYEEAFLQANLNPSEFEKARKQRGQIKAFIEMHIEQGKVLEDHDVPIGIVTNIQGPIWLEVAIQGSADHAGATPMNIRNDASLAMAEIMLQVESIAKEFDGVGTVGKLKVEPGGVNIIPGKAVFTIDLRHGDIVIRSKMVEKMYEAVEVACRKRGAKATIEVKKDVAPAKCSDELIKVLVKSCSEAKVVPYKLPCGAGHDSLLLSEITDIAMIFVRSKHGISHNPKEWSSKEDCAKGTQVLLQTLLHLAK